MKTNKCQHKKVSEILWTRGSKKQCDICGEQVVWNKKEGKWSVRYDEKGQVIKY